MKTTGRGVLKRKPAADGGLFPRRQTAPLTDRKGEIGMTEQQHGRGSVMTMLEKYAAILGTIQDLCPTAHIAGGAVRDTILDRPIKDIDLFLPNTATESAAQLLRTRFGYVKVGEWAQYEGFSDPVVERLAKFENAREAIPLCLIGLRSPMPMRENLERFDFGVCMVAWDGARTIRTDEFDRDVENKTFTLHRADNQSQFDYSMSRYRKITSDRYAGWTLSVPRDFEGFVREHSFRRDWYWDWDGQLLGPNLLKPKQR
jgi:hypothetical protein